MAGNCSLGGPEWTLDCGLVVVVLAVLVVPTLAALGAPLRPSLQRDALFTNTAPANHH